jgi:hypothetical protein
VHAECDMQPGDGFAVLAPIPRRERFLQVAYRPITSPPVTRCDSGMSTNVLFAI